MVGGKAAVEGPVSFDADGTSPVFVEGSVNFVLRHKFGFFLVGRDTRAPALLGFHGLRWYTPDARFRIVAQWKPWPQPRVLRVANVLGQVNEETSYGVAEFTLQGHRYRLEPSVYRRAREAAVLCLQGLDKPNDHLWRRKVSRRPHAPDHGLSAGVGGAGLQHGAESAVCVFSAYVMPDSARGEPDGRGDSLQARSGIWTSKRCGWIGAESA